jgi:hypothetical protein
MARIISITETAEAITANATALVWEEYDAPRKRIPRARIVEHAFSVSIPKYDDAAAPVAFVVEHYKDGSTPAYAEPVRYAAGKYFTPVRLDDRHRHSADPWESADPRAYLTAQVESLHAVSEHERTEYADAIARHEIRADEYPARTDRAQDVEQRAERIAYGLAAIDGELWKQCQEPAYIFISPGWFSSGHGWINAATHYRDYDDPYGANDAAALAYHHPHAERLGHIEVMRPDLVTIDHMQRHLANRDKETADKVEEIRAQIEALQTELEEEQRAADKARANLAAYTADPRAFWLEKCAKLESAPHSAARAEAIKQAIK